MDQFVTSQMFINSVTMMIDIKMEFVHWIKSQIVTSFSELLMMMMF